MRLRHLLIAIISAFLLSCTIADEDRCVSGYSWDAELQSCRKDTPLDTETESATDTALDSGSDTDADGGPGTDQDTGPEGFGASCTKDGTECAGYDIANYCLYNPMKPTEGGICTIKDCSPGGCPGQYQCCDCSIAIACIPPEAVGQGCTCP